MIIEYIGNHAIMMVDGILKLTETDNYFGYIHGEKLAVFGNNSGCIAKFDDIEVID